MAASSLRLVFVDLDRVDIGVRGIKERRHKMKLSIALGTTHGRAHVAPDKGLTPLICINAPIAPWHQQKGNGN
jgi:hypothetical protein